MRIRVSFHINKKPTPFNMIPFKMMMNHFAGIILLKICKGIGMLLTGKINPERMMVGSINPANEIIMAVCCVAAMVEIKIPKDKDVKIKRRLTKANKNKFP